MYLRLYSPLLSLSRESDELLNGLWVKTFTFDGSWEK